MKELALNILDIVQNSIRANARKILVGIEESEFNNLLKITISDDGSGIPDDLLMNVTDPFTTSRTTRNVGMGLALLSQEAEDAGGYLKIKSAEGAGTRVEAVFTLNHIDRQPMGDISGVIKILIIGNPGVEFIYEHKTDTGIYKIDTQEIKTALEINELNDNRLMENVRCMILENLGIIGAREVYPGSGECW